MIKNNSFLNGEIHDWYKINFGYPDHLVSNLLDKFNVQSDSKILDPFCGTGTTIIECMKRGIQAVGVDANPSSVFAAKVKTNWKIKPLTLNAHLETIINADHIHEPDLFSEDKTFNYLLESGMIARGWISSKPLLKALSIKTKIKELATTPAYKNALMLALISEVLNVSANVKFGPEIYCGPRKRDSNVLKGFRTRVENMMEDLSKIKNLPEQNGVIYQGDSRNLSWLSPAHKKNKFDFVITSPPYPTEHDYTRNARLELAFLEEVINKETLRSIKKQMIRSHTKGIYREDNDGKFVNRFSVIKKLEKKIDKAAKLKTHGFARLYSTVMKNYFGGMRLHLRSLHSYLKKGAYCAYIVGDQASYLQVPISTAKILSHISAKEGFKEEEIIHFRDRWSSSSCEFIDENILILKRI